MGIETGISGAHFWGELGWHLERWASPKANSLCQNSGHGSQGSFCVLTRPVLIDTLHNALFHALEIGVGEQQSRSLDESTIQAFVARTKHFRRLFCLTELVKALVTS